MSVISLLLEIGRQIGFILLDKKMSENIIRFAFYKDKNKKEKRLSQSNINIDKLFSNNKKNEISDKKTNLDLDKSIFEYNTEKNNLSYNFNLQNNNIVFEKIKIENKNNKILKKINYFDIIKSYICIKNKRSKLINYCHNIITKYLSVEKIAKKFNKMYILYSSLASNEPYEDLKFKNKKLKAINKYISEIKSVIKKINNINSNF